MSRYLMVMFCLLIVFPVYANTTTVTIRGPLLVGTSDSGIEGLGRSCDFLTDSEIASIIFKTCGDLDECEIIGEVDKDDNLLSVFAVRKIDIDSEPSTSIIKEAACWVSSINQSACSSPLSVVSIEITKSSSEVVNKEKFWVYDFELTIKDKLTSTTHILGSHRVQFVKRKEKWHYYR